MKPGRKGVTIIELVVVIAIVILLSSLILVVSQYVQTAGKRSRTEVEMAVVTVALENYRIDNGVYPSNETSKALNPATIDPPNYRPASSFLYAQLSGDDDANPLTSSSPNSRNYFGTSLKPSMLAPNPSGPDTYLQDPFGNSYGYSTAKAEEPNGSIGINPTFDLWSTANSSDRSSWIKNW